MEMLIDALHFTVVVDYFVFVMSICDIACLIPQLLRGHLLYNEVRQREKVR